MPSGYMGLSTFDNEFDNVGGSLDSMRHQNLVGTGIITKLEVLINDATISGSMSMGVYDDNANAPNNLLLDAGIMVAVDGWNVISGLSLSVVLNTWYWLAFNRNDAQITKYLSGQPADSHWRKAGQPMAFPDPWPAPADATNTNQYTMRAWVELPGGSGGYIGPKLLGAQLI